MKLVELILNLNLIYLYINYPSDIIFKDLKKENVENELALINDFSTADFNSKSISLIISINEDKSTRSSFYSNKNFNKIKETTNEIQDNAPEIKVIINKKIRYKDDLLGISSQTYEEIIENMFLKIRVYVNNPRSNYKIKRKISDFIKLEKIIKNEFTRQKYKKKICDNLPSLTKIEANGTPRLKEQILSFESFLNNIIINKVYITDEVLEFLELHKFNLKEIYNKERIKVTRKHYSHDCFEFARIEEENDDNIIVRESIANLKNEVNNLKLFNKYKIKKVVVVDIIISENYFKQVLDNSSNLNVEIKINIYYDDLIKTVFKTFKEIERFVTEEDDVFYNKLLVTEEDFNKSFLHFNKKDIIKNLNTFFNDIISKKIVSDNFKTFFKEVYLQEYDLKSTFNSSNHNNYNYTFMNNLYKKKQVVSVSIDVPSYTLIQNTHFKIHVFYEIHFEIKLKNDSTEKIIQKYKYREIKEYINKYNLKNGTKLILDTKQFFHKVTEKYFFRQNELLKVLNPIFNNPKLLDNSFWIKIFLYDHAYRGLKLIESNQATPAHSITESMSKQNI